MAIHKIIFTLIVMIGAAVINPACADDRNYFGDAIDYADNEGGVAVYILLGENEKKIIQDRELPLDVFGDKLTGFLQSEYGVKAKSFVDTDTASPDGGLRRMTAFSFILETGPYYDKDLDTDVFNVAQAQIVLGGVAELHKALKNNPKPPQ